MINNKFIGFNAKKDKKEIFNRYDGLTRKEKKIRRLQERLEAKSPSYEPSKLPSLNNNKIINSNKNDNQEENLSDRKNTKLNETIEKLNRINYKITGKNLSDNENPTHSKEFYEDNAFNKEIFDKRKTVKLLHKIRQKNGLTQRCR